MNTTESVHTMEPGGVMNKLIEFGGMLDKDAHDLVMKVLAYWHCDPSPTRAEWRRLFREYVNNPTIVALVNACLKEV